jgi:hypothetical protein
MAEVHGNRDGRTALESTMGGGAARGHSNEIVMEV